MSDEALNTHLDWLDDCAKEQSECAMTEWKTGNADEFLEDIMTEHVHEWDVSIGIRNEKKGIVKFFVAKCKVNGCGEALSHDEIAAHLNENATPKRDLAEAIAIMDYQGRKNPEGNSTMLWNDQWEQLRGILFALLDGKDD